MLYEPVRVPLSCHRPRMTGKPEKVTLTNIVFTQLCNICVVKTGKTTFKKVLES